MGRFGSPCYSWCWAWSAVLRFFLEHLVRWRARWNWSKQLSNETSPVKWRLECTIVKCTFFLNSQYFMESKRVFSSLNWERFGGCGFLKCVSLNNIVEVWWNIFNMCIITKWENLESSRGRCRSRRVGGVGHLCSKPCQSSDWCFTHYKLARQSGLVWWYSCNSVGSTALYSLD